MYISCYFHVTIIGVIFTHVETSSVGNKKYGHNSLKIKGDQFTKDAKLHEDLDKTFNTFKRKNSISKILRRKHVKLKNLSRRSAVDTYEILQSKNITNDNTDVTRRQYIFESPSLQQTPGLIPRQFVALNPGLHKGACLHHVCYHGGVCVRTRRGFYCDCQREYLGQHCEFKRACLRNPCRNAGSCTELGQGDFSCTCAVGSKGKTCELKDFCVPNPCNNDATCTEMDDGYHCTCKLGYKGDRCQKKALCLPNPCKNGATCVDRDEKQFECSCALGFKGKLCEVFSECKNSPCVNGGTCVEMSAGYNCACLKGFVGKNCEVTLCNPNPCANNGKCTVIRTSYNCACPGHYIGEHCEVLNPCRARPCLNGGVCVVSKPTSGYSNDGFSCRCRHGYYGNMCQMK